MALPDPTTPPKPDTRTPRERMVQEDIRRAWGRSRQPPQSDLGPGFFA